MSRVGRSQCKISEDPMKLRSLLAVLLLVTAAACHSSPTAPADRAPATPSFEDQADGGGWAGTGN